MTQRGLVCNVNNRELAPGINYLHFNIRIDTKPTARKLYRQRERSIFIPLSAEQNAAIRKYRKEKIEAEKSDGNPLEKGVLGNAAVSTYDRINFIRWEEFSPFGHSRTPSPLRLGIGTAVHAGITEFLARKFPNHRITHDIEVTQKRIDQLAAMGIDWSKEYPIEEYLAKVRKYREERKATGKKNEVKK